MRLPAVKPSSAALVIAGVVLGVGLLWLIVTGLMVRSDVQSIKNELTGLRGDVSAGNLDAARADADSISSKAHTAHGLTSGPAWWTAAHLPWVGRPAEVVRVVTAQADSLGHNAVPGVLDLADEVSNGGFRNGKTIDLAKLQSAEPTVAHASGLASASYQAVAQLPKHTWLSSLDRSRSKFQTELSTINDELSNATQALRVLPAALGADGPKRYFLGFENEAEARGLGGIPGQYAILVADHGTLQFEHFGADSELDGLDPPYDLGADFTAAYGGAGPGQFFADSDISPNFPYAAQIWSAYWLKKSGEKVDGAIAIDPTALSYLLQVTGPTTLTDGRVVSADNVVALTQQVVYALYPDPVPRKAYLVGVASALSDKLLSGGDTHGLITALGKSAQQRRLAIWTTDSTTEQFLDSVGYAGTVGTTPGPYAGFVVTNAAGTKLDYYLQRSMTYDRTGCGPNSSVTATLVLHNGAPASGLPAYVVDRSDSNAAKSKPGDNRELVSYLGTAGSKVDSVTLDGQAVPVFTGKENGGLTLMIADVEMPVGATRTIVVKLTEPAATQSPTILRQPLVQDMTIKTSGSTCG